MQICIGESDHAFGVIFFRKAAFGQQTWRPRCALVDHRGQW
jgi:hypothetical protein